jgi:hypothetical protein
MLFKRFVPIVLALFLSVSLMAPALAMKATDPVGDVAGPLDIKAVTLTWNETAMTGKIIMVDSFAPSLLEFGGGGYAMFTLQLGTHGDRFNYSVSIWKESGGGLYGDLYAGPLYGEYEYIGPVAVSRPDDHTLKFVLKRKMIS